jgi:UDP-N-acetylmuramoyl-L-alanyl-D-glutamate--2,6-diaminopimelate ligase
MNTLPSIFPVTCHTNHVGPGSTFVAIKGYEKDGADFIAQAIEKGAAALVIENEVKLSDQVVMLIKEKNVVLRSVPDTRLALAILSAQAAGNPASQLKIIGITGTKGKTTTSFLLWHILKTAGYKTALLSTVNNYLDDQKFSAPLTTAQPDYLHQFLKLCVEQGVTHVVMEVAAQALSLHRVYGIEFDGIIFTNFSLEHLEFYASMEEYFAAKCRIFALAKPHAPILINGDDAWCQKINRSPNMETFSIWEENNNVNFIRSWRVIGAQSVPESTSHDLRKKDLWIRYFWFVKLTDNSPRTNEKFSRIEAKKTPYSCPALVGSFNAYNATAASTMALKLGVSEDALAYGLATFIGVRGRFERHELPNGAVCIIDYAHNPSSYESVLSALRAMTDHLIVVFGAGGKRDPSKRPLMGGLAAQFADVVMITSDNPRTEDPEMIIADIERGIAPIHAAKVLKIVDRKIAIERAYAVARTGSIIALLGKGPDEYQIIGDQKLPFCEVEIIQSAAREGNYEEDGIGA